MEIITSIVDLRKRLANESTIAFVPTMGNLHTGHLHLMKLAHEHASCVVSSIFVNRLQFGQNEDFDRYPRTFQQDCAVLEKAGVNITFIPQETELYPFTQNIFVDPGPLADQLCGAFRPNHFRGVATVVLKLFNIVQPNIAVFGKKDYQQLKIIEMMTQQLNLPIRIIAGETQRAHDGLALSSRNQYLNEIERQKAPHLYQALEKIKVEINGGNKKFSDLEQSVTTYLEHQEWKVDYVAVRQQNGLQLPEQENQKLVVLAAGWLGNTRLIDNLEINIDA